MEKTDASTHSSTHVTPVLTPFSFYIYLCVREESLMSPEQKFESFHVPLG